jgi:hypothetical protein
MKNWGKYEYGKQYTVKGGGVMYYAGNSSGRKWIEDEASKWGKNNINYIIQYDNKNEIYHLFVERW